MTGRFVLLVLLAASVSGCLGGGCEFEPRQVSWRDPDFLAALRDADGWDVTVKHPFPGFEVHDARIVAWGANLTDLYVYTDEGPVLHLDPDGVLHLSGVPDPEPEGLRARVEHALAQATDGNQSEVAAWTDALFDSLEWEGYDHHDASMEHLLRDYETTLPVDRTAVDALIADHVEDEPRVRFKADDWVVEVSMPRAEATRDTWTFEVDPTRENRFRDSRWDDAFPSEEAVQELHAALATLDYDDAPADPRVSGWGC